MGVGRPTVHNGGYAFWPLGLSFATVLLLKKTGRRDEDVTVQVYRIYGSHFNTCHGIPS
jgi:hypothetical protein